MALAIKCLHNLSPQFSYVSTLPNVWRYAIVSCMPETMTTTRHYRKTKNLCLFSSDKNRFLM